MPVQDYRESFLISATNTILVHQWYISTWECCNLEKVNLAFKAELVKARHHLRAIKKVGYKKKSNFLISGTIQASIITSISLISPKPTAH